MTSCLLSCTPSTLLILSFKEGPFHKGDKTILKVLSALKVYQSSLMNKLLHISPEWQGFSCLFQDLLGQDVFLIGAPGPLRRQIAMMYLVCTLSMIGKNFSRQHLEIFFSFFPEKKGLIFHADCLFRRQFAWNVTRFFFFVCFFFLGKMLKIFCLPNLEWGHWMIGWEITSSNAEWQSFVKKGKHFHSFLRTAKQNLVKLCRRGSRP